jgi:hypothetical protein
VQLEIKLAWMHRIIYDKDYGLNLDDADDLMNIRNLIAKYITPEVKNLNYSSLVTLFKEAAMLEHMPVTILYEKSQCKVQDLAMDKHCMKCGNKISAWQIRNMECKRLVHTGAYMVNRGWTCCGAQRKKSLGCTWESGSHVEPIFPSL